MDYSIVKTLHIIFVITWFAGLFYIVRLFIYLREAQDKPKEKKEILSNQLKIMSKRLWFGITWPSAVLTLGFGLYMLIKTELYTVLWMQVKMGFLLILFAYHGICHKIYLDQKNNRFTLSPYQLRVFNEIATILLFGIVFLAVLKHQINLGYLALGLSLLLALILWSIKRINKKK